MLLSRTTLVLVKQLPSNMMYERSGWKLHTGFAYIVEVPVQLTSCGDACNGQLLIHSQSFAHSTENVTIVCMRSSSNDKARSVFGLRSS